MGTPHLESLRIEGFCGLQKLELRRLGHVNLLVGKNGAGKSTVLDAVRLYASRFELDVLQSIVEARGGAWSLSSPDGLSPLFQGWTRWDSDKYSPVISIANRSMTVIRGVRQTGKDSYLPVWLSDDRNDPSWIPVLCVLEDDAYRRQAPYLGTEVPLRYIEMANVEKDSVSVPCRSLGSGGLSDRQAASLFDEAVREGIEERVNRQLAMAFPDFERLGLVGDAGTRQFVGSVRNARRKVPLKSLGDGVKRFLDISLAVMDVQSGFVLIDEFENGLHYSVQRAAWKFVFDIAREQKLQVFVTTHSEDCVAAFSSVANEEADLEGVVTRMEWRNGVLLAYQYDEELLATSIEHMVDVR